MNVHPSVSSARGESQRRIKDTLDTRQVTVILDSGDTNSVRLLRARFVSQMGVVLTLQLTAALGQSVTVGLAGEIQTANGRQSLQGQYRVRSCRCEGIGLYLIDLEPQTGAGEESGEVAGGPAEQSDHYEVLQVSRQADSDTIHRVYHVLAQRYHPDNVATGHPERFRQVVEAHAVLSNPDRRAAYDVRLAEEDRTRLRIFDSLESTEGVMAEARKREGILRLLYTRRLVDARDASMGGRDFAKMLGCPVEHLEFSLWFLREKRLVVRSDNNRFEITWQGVEAYENIDSTPTGKLPLQLPAPASPAA